MRALLFALLLLGVVSGCARYRGSAVPSDPSRAAREGGWILLDDVPLVRQAGPKDCGLAALSSVLRFWGAEVDASEAPPRDVALSLGELGALAERRGFYAFAFTGSFDDLLRELEHGRPVVVGVVKPYSNDKGVAHFQVVAGYHPSRRRVLLMDPADGWRESPLEGFDAEWRIGGRVTLVVFRLEDETDRAARSP